MMKAADVEPDVVSYNAMLNTVAKVRLRRAPRRFRTRASAAFRYPLCPAAAGRACRKPRALRPSAPRLSAGGPRHS